MFAVTRLPASNVHEIVNVVGHSEAEQLGGRDEREHASTVCGGLGAGPAGFRLIAGPVALPGRRQRVSLPARSGQGTRTSSVGTSAFASSASRRTMP